MAKLSTKKITATISGDAYHIGAGAKGLFIKNQGNYDCQIDFDKAISADAYLLENGETLYMETSCIKFYFKSVNGSTDLYLIKVL